MIKIYKYTLTGETPSKKNSRINTRSGRSFPNQKFVKWHTDKMAELVTFGTIPPEPIKGPCRVSIQFIHGDKRPRDGDNAAASILDLLQDAKILNNDKWEIVRQLYVMNDYAKNAAKCFIQIETIEN